MTDIRLCLMTAPDEETAARLVRTVVEEGLAACGNLIPRIRSIYRWKGEVCDETECLVLFKTTAARADALRERLVALHPYEVPEVLVLPVESGNAAYLAWVRGA
ncbi:MAG: divalent-cation tolerance protein CutA [Myxococcales bacterium]|nr:divalent-cation tolerance protein CutA [Myxococcales bacterium]